MNYQDTIILFTSRTILRNTTNYLRENGSEMSVLYITQATTFKSCAPTLLLSGICAKFHFDLTSNPGVITKFLKRTFISNICTLLPQISANFSYVLTFHLLHSVQRLATGWTTDRSEFESR
jgi:hypothetical protein